MMIKEIREVVRRVDPSEIKEWVVPDTRPNPSREPEISERPAPTPLPSAPEPKKST